MTYKVIKYQTKFQDFTNRNWKCYLCQNLKCRWSCWGYVSTWMVYHHSSWWCLSLSIYNPSVDLFHLCSQKPLCILGWSVSNLDDGFCHCIDVSTGCPVDDAFKMQDKKWWASILLLSSLQLSFISLLIIFVIIMCKCWHCLTLIQMTLKPCCFVETNFILYIISL